MPARFSAGTRNRGGDKDPAVDREFHRWCEIYLPNFGWVPIDPSSAGKSPSSLKAVRHWGAVPAVDMVMTRGGGGSDIFGWGYNGAGGMNEAVWSNKKRSK
jgi:transglutaminase-like putative cysteine protease